MKKFLFIIFLVFSVSSYAQKTQICNAIAQYTSKFAEARINGETKSQMQKRIILRSEQLKNNQPNDTSSFDIMTDGWMSGIDWVFSSKNNKLSAEQTWDKKFNECMNEINR